MDAGAEASDITKHPYNDLEYDEGDIAIISIPLARTIVSLETWGWGGEVMLRFKDDGLYFRGVDPAHVTMREVRLPQSEDLTILQERDVLLGTDDLKTLLPRKRKREQGLIVIGYERDKYRFLGEDHEKDRIILRYGRHVLKVDKKDSLGLPDPKIPTIPLPNKYNVDLKAFREAVRFIKKRIHHIKLEGTSDGLNMEAMNDTSAYVHAIPSQAVVYERPVTSLFTEVYLGPALEALKGDSLTVYIGQDFPMRLENDCLGGTDTILLAPRIEDE